MPENIKAVAVFTNQTCDTKQGRQTPEGIHTRTLWGELALQLGGVELYRKIEANDQSRIVPQGLFTDILKQASPCLILLDELADYCVGASGEEVGATTLADQTISFIQQLTEAVNQVKGVAVVATLPASHLEVSSSERGQEILNTLERRFGRMGATAKPNTPDTTGATGKQIRYIRIKGNISAENWSDIFRAFVSPAVRMDLKRLKFGIDFEMQTKDDHPLDENDSTLKTIEEAARQLGLLIEKD